jgi:predicted acetyltransferase
MVSEVRAIEPAEFETMRQTMGLVFGFDPPEGDERFRRLVPLDRTRCGFDQGRMVSTLGTFDLTMTVPGGAVSCGGTTMVAVVPTHRRQGLLRTMMRSHLDDVREHEEPIAGLWASDSAIYGRFGYGCASVSSEIAIKRGHVGFHRLAPEASPVRMIDREEATQVAPAVYQELQRHFPGFFARSADWWESRSLRDTDSSRHGATSLRYAVVDEADGIAGYVTFRTKSDWDEGHGSGEVRVKDLFGTTPESWAALWSFVVSQDLVSETVADLRSPHDPIFDLLEGSRRARAVQSDGLWVRIMDVPGALKARAYSAPIDVVLGVSDPLGDISGTYRLSANGADVTCSATGDEPDVMLDLEDLSAGYLGRARFRALARVGRVSGTDHALAAMDAAFRWDPQPWCPEIF